VPAAFIADASFRLDGGASCLATLVSRKKGNYVAERGEHVTGSRMRRPVQPGLCEFSTENFHLG